MQSNFEINVSKDGMHLFATAPRSCLTVNDATKVFTEIKTAFPLSAGYEVTVTAWECAGRIVTAHFETEFDQNNKPKKRQDLSEILKEEDAANEVKRVTDAVNSLAKMKDIHRLTTKQLKEQVAAVATEHAVLAVDVMTAWKKAMNCKTKTVRK